MSRSPLFCRLLGRSLMPLTGDLPPWSGSRELGSIAGTLSAGVGRLVRGLPRPNDGTVVESETRLENMTDHLLIHTSHTALLASKNVAEQTILFLQHGRFGRQ
jgi:hypothetical protein